ncbi:MAG: DUF11 domain-containing protein [Gammaproteobacteria bacterium]|nr:DUF11 domain-containing protein [Gammaproteobacteria bacterium]
MTPQIRRFVSFSLALVLGSGLASVYALDPSDFTNDGQVDSAPANYETNSLNNSSTVVVLPKGYSVSKTADVSGLSTPTQAGDTIRYSIVVENTGLLPLSSVTLSDSLVPASSIQFLSGDVNSNSQLDANETWAYEVNYSVLQSDIDTNGGGDGDIDNTVTVSATELAPTSDSVAVPITQAPSFSLSKTVDQTAIGSLQTLNYTIEVENSGNQTLSGIALVDTLPDGSSGSLSGPISDVGAIGVLDVGETWQYTISYSVSQSEIDAGLPLQNAVSATTTETGASAQTASAQTTINQSPQFTVSKSVLPTSLTSPGSLNYQIDVQNTGNTSLTGLNLSDVLPDGATATLSGPVADSGLVGILDVGETWAFTAGYVASQAEIDDGSDLVNQVSATANETGLAPVSDFATTTINQTPDIAVTKVVDQLSVNTPSTLNYTITVSNAGNVSLTNVQLVDALPDGTNATLLGPISDAAAIGVLDVGESWEFTTDYLVSQADIDSGTPLTNRVEVQSDQTNSSVFSASATTTVVQTPSMNVDKVVDELVITSGTPLNYTITVRNTGNVSLTNIVPADTLPDGSVASLLGPVSDSGTPGVLDVGESWIYTTSYNANQADVDGGIPLINTVSVSSSEAGTVSDNAGTNVIQTPSISIVKTSLESTFIRSGDVLNYTLEVQNNGNVGLSNVQVADPNADAGSLICAQNQPFYLTVTETVTCTATHTVSDTDVQLTEVVNRASVTSMDPSSNPIVDSTADIVVSMSRIPPVATSDFITSLDSAVPVTLPGASNDTDDNNDIDLSATFLTHADAIDTDSDGDADFLSVLGQGDWSINDASGDIMFSPLAGFTADPTPVEYQIVDATGLISNPAMLSVDYPQSSPVARDDLKVNPDVPAPGNPTVVSVLEDNGNGADTDAQLDLNPVSISFADAAALDTNNDGYKDQLIVLGEGVWQIDPATTTVTFTPELNFFADPTPVSYTVSDINGLVSNEALVTVDYPQRAPDAQPDELMDQPLGETITVAVLANDTDPENNILPQSVRIVDSSDSSLVTELVVAGEGTWQVDEASGSISFTAEFGFVASPTPISYVVSDTTGYQSAPTTVTIGFEAPASLQGIVWVDTDRDGVVDANESRKSGWTLRVINEAGIQVAEVQTAADGSYSVTGLIPGAYRVDFYNPFGVFMDSATTDGNLVAGQTINLPLPLDPGGVVYDSLTRLPVEGVTLALVNATNQAVDPSCLAAGQQNQTTGEDGLYAFNLEPGAHSSCPINGSYRIELAEAPDSYHPYFSSLIRQEGAAGCGGPSLGCAVSSIFDSSVNEINCTVDTLPGTGACEVQRQPEAPQEGEDTRYFVAFEFSAGDRSIVFNHLPLDARANDAEILITKSADRRQASIGDLVLYTVTLENTKDVPALQVDVIDSPPAGFSFVPTSAQLIRAGSDQEFDTEDDLVVSLTSEGNRPVLFNSIDLDSEETVRIRYVSRVGTGVVAGTYVNLVYAQAPNGTASNEASASVEVISDPVLNQATLIGKVFHDRDEDGVQDSATASGVVIRSDYYGMAGLALGQIPGRRTVNDDPAVQAVTVNMPLGDDNRFAIRTREGTRISVDENGTITEAHVGIKARGMSSQDIRVCTQQTQAVPNLRNGDANASAPIDVLQIVLSNQGINEEGIPGVRLATVTGLIIETDAFGRYSIPDVELGTDGLGRNFVLKVDPASLPDGSHFTTENPYVLRIVNTTLNKINFGVNYTEQDSYGSAMDACTESGKVAQQQIVEVTLGSVFFDVGKDVVRKDQLGIVRDIISKLKLYGGGTIRVTAHTDSTGSAIRNIDLANRRANTIRRVLRESLGAKLMKNVTVEVAPMASEEKKP